MPKKLILPLIIVLVVAYGGLVYYNYYISENPMNIPGLENLFGSRSSADDELLYLTPEELEALEAEHEDDHEHDPVDNIDEAPFSEEEIISRATSLPSTKSIEMLGTVSSEQEGMVSYATDDSYAYFSITTNLVELPENEYYMAWFVVTEAPELILVSTLMMTDGTYGFTVLTDFPELVSTLSKLIITKELVDDETPEEYILEASFLPSD